MLKDRHNMAKRPLGLEHSSQEQNDSALSSKRIKPSDEHFESESDEESNESDLYWECPDQCGCTIKHQNPSQCKGQFVDFESEPYKGKNCLCSSCNGACLPAGGESGGCEDCQECMEICTWCDACHVIRGRGMACSRG